MESRNKLWRFYKLITKAEKNDVITVSKSYLELFSYETEYGSQTNWVSGLYPSEKTALTAFENRTLYVLKENNVFCGSIILNYVQSPEYQTINWDYPAAALYNKMGFRLAGTAPMLLQGVIQEQQIFFEYEVK